MDDQNNVQSSLPQQSLTSPAPRSNVLKISIIGLLLLLVGFTGGYLVASKNTPRTSSDTRVATQNTPSPAEKSQLTVTPSPASDETANWKTYANADLSFKYPAEWTLSGSVITSKSPKIKLVAVSKEEILMNECMKESATQTKNGLILRMFTRVTTGAMCQTSDATPREIWVIPDRNAHSPGISYSYSADDAFYAENQFDQILSTFKFTK